MSIRLLVAATFGVGAVALVSCGGTGTRSGTSTPDSAMAVRAETSSSAGEFVADSGSDGSAAVGRWLTDANLLSLFELVNSHQIAMAQAELQRWHSDTVRAFAELMIRDHSAMQGSVDSVAHRLRIAPIAPALDSTVAPRLKGEVDSLKLTAGMLDHAYLDAAIRDQASMLTSLEQLAGSADRSELRDVLLQVYARMQLHELRARQLKAQLSAGAAAADSASHGHRATERLN